MDRPSPDIHDCPRFALEAMAALAIIITVAAMALIG